MCKMNENIFINSALFPYGNAWNRIDIAPVPNDRRRLNGSYKTEMYTRTHIDSEPYRRKVTVLIIVGAIEVIFQSVAHRMTSLNVFVRISVPGAIPVR
jgi:hypothetical protein